MNHRGPGCVSTGMPLRSGSRPLLVALLTGAVALGVAACGDDADDPAATDGTSSSTTAPEGGGDDDYLPGGSSGGAEAEEGTIVASDFSFADLTVAPGDQIVLRNDDEAPHTATADDAEFDLGQVSPGETSEPGTAPTEPGDYAFHCEIHPAMTATLTVEG